MSETPMKKHLQVKEETDIMTSCSNMAKCL